VHVNPQHAGPSTNIDVKDAAYPVKASYDDSPTLEPSVKQILGCSGDSGPSRGSIKEDLDHKTPYNSLPSKTQPSKSLDVPSIFFFF